MPRRKEEISRRVGDTGKKVSREYVFLDCFSPPELLGFSRSTGRLS